MTFRCFCTGCSCSTSRACTDRHAALPLSRQAQLLRRGGLGGDAGVAWTARHRLQIATHGEGDLAWSPVLLRHSQCCKKAGSYFYEANSFRLCRQLKQAFTLLESGESEGTGGGRAPPSQHFCLLTTDHQLDSPPLSPGRALILHKYVKSLPEGELRCTAHLLKLLFLIL